MSIERIKRPASEELRKHRVLIGSVGYHNLRNFSIGPKLLPALQSMDWPPGIEVEEMNWGPIAIVQRFEAMSDSFERVVFLTARPDNRPVGQITLWRWRGGLPDAENLQARIGDAVTGVISIDNLLIIGEHFKIWPPEVFVVDVAPGEEEAGEVLTPEVERRVPEILATIRRLALAPMERLPDFIAMRGDSLAMEA